jgi:Cu2+-exporting ATPase
MALSSLLVVLNAARLSRALHGVEVSALNLPEQAKATVRMTSASPSSLDPA